MANTAQVFQVEGEVVYLGVGAQAFQSVAEAIFLGVGTQAFQLVAEVIVKTPLVGTVSSVRDPVRSRIPGIH